MIEVRKLKSSDAAQRNPAIKYVIQFSENRQYFTEKALIELQNKLNIFALHGVVGQSEQLLAFANHVYNDMLRSDRISTPEQVVEDFLSK